MAREVKYMCKNAEEYNSLKGGVLSYLQRDIEKLFKMHNLDAEFMNFSTPARNGPTWIYLRVYYVAYQNNDDMFGDEYTIKAAVPLDLQLFTRDPDMMELLDSRAHINKNKLDDSTLVKARILYIVYRAINAIQNGKCPVKLPTKNWIVVNISDDGNDHWSTLTHAPGGGY